MLSKRLELIIPWAKRVGVCPDLDGSGTWEQRRFRAAVVRASGDMP